MHTASCFKSSVFFFFAPQVLSWKHTTPSCKNNLVLFWFGFFSLHKKLWSTCPFLHCQREQLRKKRLLGTHPYTVLLYSCWHSRLIVAIYPNYHNLVQSPSVCHHHAASSGCPMLCSWQLMRPSWLHTFFYFLCLNRNNLFGKLEKSFHVYECRWSKALWTDWGSSSYFTAFCKELTLH